MKNFVKIAEGCWLNLEMVYEFGVVPFYEGDVAKYVIMYWDIFNEEHQLHGWYETEKEAEEKLDLFMMGEWRPK